jgi:hypothetical protein
MAAILTAWYDTMGPWLTCFQKKPYDVVSNHAHIDNVNFLKDKWKSEYKDFDVFIDEAVAVMDAFKQMKDFGGTWDDVCDYQYMKAALAVLGRDIDDAGDFYTPPPNGGGSNGMGDMIASIMPIMISMMVMMMVIKMMMGAMSGEGSNNSPPVKQTYYPTYPLLPPHKEVKV